MRGEPSPIVGEYTITPKRMQKMSRYGKLKRYTNEDGKSYIETPRKFVIKESTKDIFYSVEKGYENRLDLISYKFYNSPFLWWAIASMNHIDNPMKVEAGMVLRIPSMSSIYSSGGILTMDEEGV